MGRGDKVRLVDAPGFHGLFGRRRAASGLGPNRGALDSVGATGRLGALDGALLIELLDRLDEMAHGVPGQPCLSLANNWRYSCRRTKGEAERGGAGSSSMMIRSASPSTSLFGAVAGMLAAAGDLALAGVPVMTGIAAAAG